MDSSISSIVILISLFSLCIGNIQNEPCDTDGLPLLQQNIQLKPEVHKNLPLSRIQAKGPIPGELKNSRPQSKVSNFDSDWQNISPDELPNCKPCASLSPLYVYNNSVNYDHAYTTNYREFAAGKYGYVRESTQLFVKTTRGKSTVPFVAYFNPQSRQHFYATGGQGLEIGDEYKFKGIVGYVFPNAYSGLVPIGHFKNIETGEHIYTPSIVLFGNARSQDFEFQGIIGYTCPFVYD